MIPNSMKPILRKLSLIRPSTEGQVFAHLDAYLRQHGLHNDADSFAQAKNFATAAAALKRSGPRRLSIVAPRNMDAITRALYHSGPQGRKIARDIMANVKAKDSDAAHIAAAAAIPLFTAAFAKHKAALSPGVVPAMPAGLAGDNVDLIANFATRKVSVAAPSNLSAREKALWAASPLAAEILAARGKRVPGPRLPVGVTPSMALESIEAELLRSISKPRA